MDGARDVTQAPIMPGQSFTYRFAAYPPGTHYYHSVRVQGCPLADTLDLLPRRPPVPYE